MIKAIVFSLRKAILLQKKRSRSVPTLTFDLHRKRAYAKIIKSAVGSTVIRRTFDVKLHEQEFTHYHRLQLRFDLAVMCHAESERLRTARKSSRLQTKIPLPS